MNIYHNSQDDEYRMPFGAIETGGFIKLRIKVLEDERNCSVLSVKLVIRREGGESGSIQMTDEIGGYYTAEFRVPQTPCILWYHFSIEYSKKGNVYSMYYGNNVDGLGGKGNMYNLEEETKDYQITIFKKTYTPEWYKNAIVYQIFPDRFMRDSEWETRCAAVLNDADNNANKNRFIEKDWYERPYYVRDEKGNPCEYPFFGGSLKGIEGRLDYLAYMGVNAIYLNPIFQANSNHRYDTSNYLMIDPMLGTEEDFRNLCDAARKRDIRIILEGVFKYTGADSIYFDKYNNFGGTGGYNNLYSKFRYWYSFEKKTIEKDDYTVNKDQKYDAWNGNPNLPIVDDNNLLFRQFICGTNGVLTKWILAGASGWKLDAADWLSETFVKSVRQRIKDESEDNVLIGDIWDDHNSSKLRSNNTVMKHVNDFDSIMNYPLRDILFDFLTFKETASKTLAKIMSLMENFPPEKFYSALNIIGSHDTERALTLLNIDNNKTSAIARLKISVALQYTLPGVPCIYYGDEAGMQGAGDPENRAGYIWNREDDAIRAHYYNLGKYYHNHSALKNGEFIPIAGELDVSDDILAFIRRNKEETLLILANRNKEARSFFFYDKEYAVLGQSCLIKKL